MKLRFSFVTCAIFALAIQSLQAVALYKDGTEAYGQFLGVYGEYVGDGQFVLTKNIDFASNIYLMEGVTLDGAGYSIKTSVMTLIHYWEANTTLKNVTLINPLKYGININSRATNALAQNVTLNCGYAYTGADPGLASWRVVDCNFENWDYKPANAAPELTSISAPIDPVQINSSIAIEASYYDEDISDVHTATVNWGDGVTTQGTVDKILYSISASHTYAAPGLYTLTVTVSDDKQNSTSLSHSYVVIYDPTGGFVTGGGVIYSPAGAYVSQPELAGKANFGFNSKYTKGASVPTGSTQFQFKVGSLSFKSTSYDWLVIASNKAQFKGVGTVNGAGDYGFLLTAVDGNIRPVIGVDTFRIKIWDRSSDEILYDNQISGIDEDGTELSGGSIVIHN